MQKHTPESESYSKFFQFSRDSSSKIIAKQLAIEPRKANESVASASPNPITLECQIGEFPIAPTTFGE